MIIQMPVAKDQIINMNEFRSNSNKLRDGLIAPAKEEMNCVLAPEHAAEPIKSMDDIVRISEYLIEHKKYRDNMLFICGINFGLRASDLRMLQFGNLINENLTFKENFPVFEKKTRNTRKKKKNRYITINNAVIEAVTLFLENTPGVSLSDYMFKSESNKEIGKNEPITVRSIERILKNAASALDINVKVSTHTLRKTFCYHQMRMSDNSMRKLYLLQRMLHHSSPMQTLEYIGITDEEIEEAYKHLNLGSKTQHYLIDSKIVEFDAYAG